MRLNMIITGLALAALAPGSAFAQWQDPNCVQSNHDSRVEGTVLGAVGGALLGGALSKHSRGAGIALGALGGGAAGNAIAGTRNDPCPSYGPPPPPAYGPPPRPAYYAPPPPPPAPEGGLHHWIASLQQRIAADRDQGVLTNRQARHGVAELAEIQRGVDHLTWRDGGVLSPPDHDMLRDRLSGFTDRLSMLEGEGR